MRSTRGVFFLLALALASVLLMGATKSREGTEWDTAYWYNANDSKLPRVLLLGDSICNGYQTLVRDELAGVAYVSFWATSKCVVDRSYLKQLTYILEEYDYAVIHYNNGLHSLNTDRADWEAGLRAALKLIREKGKGAKLIWATSTPLKDPALTEKAKELNAIAARVVKEQGIPTDDLFALMDPQDRNKLWSDTYHYHMEGRKMQAKQVADSIRESLGGKTATATEARAALASAASETGPDGKLETVKAGPNLLANGGFEATGGWSVYPPKPEAGTFTLTEENARSGKKCAKITTLTMMQLVNYRPPLSAGTSYRLRFQARAEKPGKITVHLRTQKPPYQMYGEQQPELTAAWKEYAADLTTPDGFKPEDFVLLFNLPPGNAFYFDDVIIEKK